MPADGEDLGLEAPALADRAGDKDVGEKLHLDAFVAEALAVVAAAVAAVEGEAGGAEAGGLCGGRGGEELADAVPRLGVEGGIGARRAREGRLVHEHDVAERQVAREARDLRGVFDELVALREQALVDHVVEQRGFAGAGDAAERDETLERQPHGEVAEVVFGNAVEMQRRVILWHRAA